MCLLLLSQVPNEVTAFGIWFGIEIWRIYVTLYFHNVFFLILQFFVECVGNTEVRPCVISCSYEITDGVRSFQVSLLPAS